MINYNSNINVIVKARLEQLQALKDNPDPIIRTVALTVLPELKKRVHVDGKDSEGKLIGTYSPGYMVVRTGNFQNAARYKKGEKAGQFKTKKGKGEAGIFTKRGYTKFTQEDEETVSSERKFLKSEFENKARPTHNRTNDTKVVLSLTRQMENDLSVIQSGNGYGIGYLNPDNFKKAQYCEATYKKPILTKLTKEERELAKDTAQNFLPEYLNSLP